MKQFKIKLIVFLTLLMAMFPSIANAAGSVKASISGNNTVYNGNQITVTLRIDNVTSGDNKLYSIGGILNFDSNYLEFVSSKSVSSLTESKNLKTYKFAYADYTMQNGVGAKSDVATYTFVAKKEGKTTISFKTPSSTDANSNLSTNISSKTITITAPPSNNNNLSSLSLSDGTLNFNKNTTTYNVDVNENVTSVTVSGTAEDKAAKISGLGLKKLNYGKNEIKVTVKAATGDIKTYTIIVNRRDNRSNNNNLSSLSVSGVSLEPKFNKNTTEYKIEVDYSVSKLDIKAEPEDSKATVNISNNNLAAEKVTSVKISVTAENGSTKNYIIKAKRGKNPNKVLSSNNNLASLRVSVGMLSPEFNKEKTNYIVYVPYEINKIDIETNVEDTEYASINAEGPDFLGVGENIYKFTVKAEDESTKVYTVTVARGKNLDDGNLSDNVFLRELSIKNGKLTSAFKENVYVYHYKKTKKDLEVTALASIEDATVNIMNNKGVYVIIVSAPSGNKSFYVLIPESTNNLIIPFIILMVILILSATLLFIRKKKITKKGSGHNKK